MPNKRRLNQKPISLHPLKPEEVLADLFRVKPEIKSKNETVKKDEKEEGSQEK